MFVFFFFSSRRRHTRCSRDWSSDVCSSDLRRCAAALMLSAIALLGQTGPPSIQFTDVTKNAGITFTHYTGAFGKKYLPETLGPGVAFIDYDGDGWQDLFFTNG